MSTTLTNQHCTLRWCGPSYGARGPASAVPAGAMRVAGGEHQLQVALDRLCGLSMRREVPADASVHDGGDLPGQVATAPGRERAAPVQEVADQRLVLAGEPVQLCTAGGERCRLWQAAGALHVARAARRDRGDGGQRR